MTRSNGSDNWRDKISDYVLGNLDPNEVTALQEQIALDPALAEDLAELQEILSALPYALPRKSLSSALKASIMAAAEGGDPQAAHLQHTVTNHTAQKISLKSRRQRRLHWNSLARAIAATIILVLGVQNYRLQQQINAMAQRQQTLQQNQFELERLQTQVQTMTTVVTSLQSPNSLVYALKGTGSAEGATGRLVTIPGHQEMVLVSENLPLLSDNQIYRLWAIADEAVQPQYCGQFRTNAVGAVQWIAPTENCSQPPTQLLITLDKPNDPIDSAGPLVMQSQT